MSRLHSPVHSSNEVLMRYDVVGWEANSQKDVELYAGRGLIVRALDFHIVQ